MNLIDAIKNGEYDEPSCEEVVILADLDKVRDRLDSDLFVVPIPVDGELRCIVIGNSFYYSQHHKGKWVTAIANTTAKAEQRLKHMINDGWR